MFESLGSLIGLAIFIIIMIACQKAIKEGLKMSGRSSWILAACVATLAVIGMIDPSYKDSSEIHLIPLVLVLYTTLGLSILILLTIAFLRKYRNKSSDQFIQWSADTDPDSNKYIKK